MCSVTRVLGIFLVVIVGLVMSIGSFSVVFGGVGFGFILFWLELNLYSCWDGCFVGF